MCEFTRHCMAEERHGKGMDAAWARHGMCELAFKVQQLVSVPKRYAFKNSTSCLQTLFMALMSLRTDNIKLLVFLIQTEYGD
jgi:hypothetical protein